MKDISMNPTKEIEIPSGHLLKVMKPLYGLDYSGDYWSATFYDHIKNDLKMAAAESDLDFVFKKAQSQLTGFLATHVYDNLSCGDTSFENLTENTSNKFESKPKSFDNTRFAGTYIEKIDNGKFRVLQERYIERLQQLSLDCDYRKFRSARAQLLWLVHTIPDICATANLFAQVTPKILTSITFASTTSACVTWSPPKHSDWSYCR